VAALATLGCQKVKFTVRSAALGAGLEVDVVGLSQVSQLTDRLGDAPVVVSTLPANALTCRISRGIAPMVISCLTWCTPVG
jgi:hypothetical protein